MIRGNDMYCKWCRQEKDEEMGYEDGEPICEACIKVTIPFYQDKDGGYFDNEEHTGIW